MAASRNRQRERTLSWYWVPTTSDLGGTRPASSGADRAPYVKFDPPGTMASNHFAGGFFRLLAIAIITMMVRPEHIMARDASNRRARERVMVREMAGNAADHRSFDAASRLGGSCGHQAGWHGQCD